MRVRRGFSLDAVLLAAPTAICLVAGVLTGVMAWKTAVESAETERLAAHDERQRQAASDQTIEPRERTSQHAITFTHDNHWWVARSRLNADYLVHHPDCPCRKPVTPAKQADNNAPRVWRVIRGYSGLNRVEDETGKLLFDDMSEHQVYLEARLLSKGLNVQLKFFDEEPEGLVPTAPWYRMPEAE